jgi:hypothetical protein
MFKRCLQMPASADVLAAPQAKVSELNLGVYQESGWKIANFFQAAQQVERVSGSPQLL